MSNLNLQTLELLSDLGSSTRDLEYSSFEWNGCQRLFEKSISDVLLLLDCCSAAAAATVRILGFYSISLFGIFRELANMSSERRPIDYVLHILEEVALTSGTSQGFFTGSDRFDYRNNCCLWMGNLGPRARLSLVYKCSDCRFARQEHSILCCDAPQ